MDDDKTKTKNDTQIPEHSSTEESELYADNIHFAFESERWSKANESRINLRQVRKSGDRHISFRKKQELHQNESPCTSSRSMAEVSLNSQRNLNFQNPQSTHERFQRKLRHLHSYSTSTIDENNAMVSSDVQKKGSKDGKNDPSKDDTDDFDLVPTFTLICRKEMKFWIPVYLCLILCLSLLTVIIIIHTHRSDGDSLIRRGNNTHQGNFTMSSSSFIEEGRKRDFLLQDQEESDIETTHFIVKACIEKIHTPPNRCQEQCESKKCCFEEFNCETTLTVHQCTIYAACRDWLVTTYIGTVEVPQNTMMPKI